MDLPTLFPDRYGEAADIWQRDGCTWFEQKSLSSTSYGARLLPCIEIHIFASLSKVISHFDLNFLHFRMDNRQIVDWEGSETLAVSFLRVPEEVLLGPEWM